MELVSVLTAPCMWSCTFGLWGPGDASRPLVAEPFFCLLVSPLTRCCTWVTTTVLFSPVGPRIKHGREKGSRKQLARHATRSSGTFMFLSNVVFAD